MGGDQGGRGAEKAVQPDNGLDHLRKCAIQPQDILDHAVGMRIEAVFVANEVAKAFEFGQRLVKRRVEQRRSDARNLRGHLVQDVLVHGRTEGDGTIHITCQAHQNIFDAVIDIVNAEQTADSAPQSPRSRSRRWSRK